MRTLMDAQVSITGSAHPGAIKAGLDAAELSGHSLRAGFCTEAAQAGADPFAIAAVTRHKNIQTLTAYVRRRDAFKQRLPSALRV
jgi:integrase